MKILTAIPWFVWPLLGFVILRGVKALQSQVLSIKKLVIVPLVFLFIGINGLMDQNLPFACIAIWCILFALAAYIIWYRTQPLKIICDRQKGLIQVPGTWTTLILLLSIFISRFTFGYLSATHPELKNFLLFNLTNLSISGIICGISIGRLIALLMKFFKSDHVDLREAE